VDPEEAQESLKLIREYAACLPPDDEPV
jgi:hypothetical protein